MMTINKNEPLLNVFYLAMLSVILASISCGNEDPEGDGNDKEKITAMSKAREKAFIEGDAAAIATHFTNDAYLMAPDKPVARGRQAVQSYYQSIFDQFKTKLESHYDEVEISGNLAYGRGFAKVILFPKAGGDSVVSTAKYLNILKKQPDGTWKTTHDIWNSN